MLTLKAKLIALAVILAVLGGGIFYVWNLNNSVEKLETQNYELTLQKEAAEALIVEDERREEVVDQVTVIYDQKRAENEVRYIEKVKEIDEDVRQGKDKPVGPLLTEFLNSGMQ